MSKELYIYGTGAIAEVASYYFENDTDYELKGFINKSHFINGDYFIKKPVIEFEEFVKHFVEKQVSIFVAVGYLDNNKIRTERFFDFDALGFKIASYVSSKATVLIDRREIGRNTFILEQNVLQPFVKIGDNCILWSGNHIGHHSKIKSHNFISSHVVISGKCELDEGCFFGVNSTVFDGVKVGRNSVIGGGSIVRRDLPDNSIVKAPISQITDRKLQ